MSKYWIRSNKVIKPRDLIFALKKPEHTLNAEGQNPETHKKTHRGWWN